MAIIRFLLMVIEEVNFRYSFLNFELEGWSEQIYKDLQKDKYIIRKSMVEMYDFVRSKLFGVPMPLPG